MTHQPFRHVLCDDGRIFKGNFANGVCEGYAEMTSPPGVSDTRLAKGAWKDGRLSGVAIVYFHDNQIYIGDWVDGVQDGHGTLVSEHEDRCSAVFSFSFLLFPSLSLSLLLLLSLPFPHSLRLFFSFPSLSFLSVRGARCAISCRI